MTTIKNIQILFLVFLSCIIIPLTGCKNCNKKYDKIYEGFPHHTGEIVRFKTEDDRTLEANVGPIMIDVYSRKGIGSGCEYSNVVNWSLIDLSTTINCQVTIAGSNGGYTLRLNAPFECSTSQSFYNTELIETLTINGKKYTDLFAQSKMYYSNPTDSAWFSHSKGLVKLKYNGKIYERVL